MTKEDAQHSRTALQMALDNMDNAKVYTMIVLKELEKLEMILEMKKILESEKAELIKENKELKDRIKELE